MNSQVFEWTGKIRRSLTGILRHDMDMAGVSGTEAARLVDEYAEIERLAATGKLVAAARVAETPAWEGQGDRDAATWLARKTGTTKRDAQRSLDAARQLADLPATREAAERGELSQTQLHEVTEAAAADPGSEQQLLASAKNESVAELKDRARKVQASAGDRATRHERIRRRRALRHGTDADGEFWMSYRNTADVGAAMLAALQPIQDAIFRDARQRGEYEPTEAYAADALAEAVCGHHSSSSGSGKGFPPRPNRPRPSRDVKVIVRIDHAAHVRGYTEPGEVCDIAGVGPVPVSTVKEMMGDAFLAAIVTDGEDVVSAVHLGRGPNALQQTALEFTQPDCRVAGCGCGWFLQTDHRTGFEKTKNTMLDDLDRLCAWHHYLKTHHGWRLEPGRGKRAFLSPEQQQERQRGHDPPGDAA